MRISFVSQLKYIENFRIRIFALSTLFAASRNMPTLLAFISCIVSVTAKPEMRRINTRWVIARMEDMFSLNVAIKQQIGNSMRTLSFILPCAYTAIPVRESVKFPFPAGFNALRDIYVFKKFFNVWICGKEFSILILHVASLIFRLFATRLEALTSQP